MDEREKNKNLVLRSLYPKYRYLYSPVYIDTFTENWLFLYYLMLFYTAPIKCYKHNHTAHIFK